MDKTNKAIIPENITDEEIKRIRREQEKLWTGPVDKKKNMHY